MKKEKLSLNVESLKLSEEALKQLKLCGIDRLEDINTFSLKELRMLLSTSFDEVSSILRRYSLPRDLENLNISKEVIKLLKQQSIHDTVDLLEFDRHALYHIFESDKILIQEMNDVLNFFEFDAQHKHEDHIEEKIDVADFISTITSSPNDKKTYIMLSEKRKLKKVVSKSQQAVEDQTIHVPKNQSSNVETLIEVKKNNVNSVFDMFLVTHHFSSQENQDNVNKGIISSYRFHFEETTFLASLLSEGFQDFDTLIDMAENEGLNASIIHSILLNYTVIENNRRIVKHPLVNALKTFEVIYDELPLNIFFNNQDKLLNDLEIFNFKDIKISSHRLEVIVFVHYHLQVIINYLIICSKDFDENLQSYLDLLLDQPVFKSENMRRVFLFRTIENMTLEEVGNLIGLTRERIRQIEINYLDKVQLESTIPMCSLIEVELKEYFKTSNMINMNTIIEKYGKKTEVVKFMLTSNNYKVKKIKSDQYLVKDPKWFEVVEKYFESKSAEIYIIDIIEELNVHDYNYFEQDIIHIMSYNYHLSDLIFIQMGNNLTRRYLYIIKKYFPKGIYLYQKEAKKQFREFFKMEYNLELDSSERSIEAIIQNNCVLSGKSLYMHPEFQKELSPELLNLIKEFLDNMEYAISFRGMFNIFQYQLSDDSIHSINEFQGIISRHFKDDFNISKSYVFKKPFTTFREVLETITKGKYKFCIDEFKLEFPSIEEYTLLNFIMSKKNLLALLNKCYLNLSFISLDKTIIQSIKAFIDSQIKDIIVSSDILYDFMIKYHPDILLTYEISNTKSLYDFIKYFFSDDYQFKGIFIGKLGSHIPSKIEQVMGLVENHDEIDIQEWIKKQDAQGIRIISFHSFLEDIKDEYMRISTYRLIKIQHFNISDDEIYKVKEFLINILDKHQIFKLNEISLFHRLPKLNYDWSIYILAEIIERFIPEITLIKNFYSYTKIDFYITIDKLIRTREDLERILN